MDIKKFEKKIRHLSQINVITASVSSLNKLLIEKGVINEAEIQKYILEWMKEHKGNTKGYGGGGCPNK